ncbi:AraC family transcriptional regulator [Caballeronia terrestris]|jgi:AraC-like DNA-binding protein|uniref:AraC family transcriptional regulator n=1 Tax=Caballeronia terrestris TaxID=1226301 RepID=A0A158IJM8_9BURK|nr:helix-turn-helix domain-containing protein [Caballeronia terrestris]SAL56754.1 AraC family transcriptional regulator [Caballeronia terrestris]
MKPAYEHVEMGSGCSVRVYHRQLPRIPFEWHHHPEYELTLTMNSRGKRYIGDSIATYAGDDLVLVPPDLPHTWSSNRSIDASAPQVAIVVWFGGDWARRVADCCPEYDALHRLLRRAACGLAFSPEAGAALRQRSGELLAASARERLNAVLDVLCQLADADAQPLASPSAFDGSRIGRPSGHEPERINRALAVIEARFAQRLTLAELAASATLSERTLNRYFVQHVGESVGKYVNRVRIGHACRMLADTSWPVSVIAARSGFPNIANFNRQFRAFKDTTPAAYRKEFTGKSQQPLDTTPLDLRSPSLERGARQKRPSAP